MKNDKWKMAFKFRLNDKSLRVLLWDLDGTLVRGRRFGAFKDYTVPMLETVFGTAGCLHDLIVSGMTDLQIVEEALRNEGITREHINSRRDELLTCYMDEMKRVTSNGQQVLEAMPGAREVLQAVNEHPRYASALLTGNIEPAAQLKVELTGLDGFFPLPSGDCGGTHQRTSRRSASTQTIHCYRRHAQRHRLRPAFRRAGGRHRDRSNVQPRGFTRLSPRRSATRSFRCE